MVGVWSLQGWRRQEQSDHERDCDLRMAAHPAQRAFKMRLHLGGLDEPEGVVDSRRTDAAGTGSDQSRCHVDGKQIMILNVTTIRYSGTGRGRLAIYWLDRYDRVFVSALARIMLR